MALMEKVAYFAASEKIEGDYLEFGVYRGQAFGDNYHMLKSFFERRIGETSALEDIKERQSIWDNVRFFAFDSFEGLPELQGVDRDTSDFAKGQYAAGLEEFRDTIISRGIPIEKVICVPGWFEQTCTQATREAFGMKKAAVIWADCDLYNFAKCVLSFISPLLQDGTVVIFDDWYCYRANPRRGEQLAFRMDGDPTRFHIVGISEGGSLEK